MPRREREAPSAAAMMVKYRPWALRPASKTRWNSARRRRRRPGGRALDGMQGDTTDRGVVSQSETYRDAETVSRFRPFARRRLRTRHPFFVLMRTRKPCVRLRWRRFG